MKTQRHFWSLSRTPSPISLQFGIGQIYAHADTFPTLTLRSTIILEQRDFAVEHRLAPSGHPQTSGMVERFDGCINELLQQTGFDSRADLQAILMNYLKLYSHHTPQRAPDARTLIQTLKE